MNAVIYARYSSHNQTEMSIEGQLKECYSYAKREGYTVITEYIDRALTGTNDKRPQFQKMLRDSEKRHFDAVIVYQLDRFARNRYDSATHKARLKKNGVKVLSARENISEDASGILMEAVLEGMAEYYSMELSQKVKRGIAISVEKRKFIGGHVPFGYTLTEDKHYAIDPETAPIVPRIFELYAGGYSLKAIGAKITEEYGKDYFGNVYNSLGRIMASKNYVGTYTRAGHEIKDAIPRLVSDELFERVQLMRNKDKKTPARARAYEDYLLATKLYCGYDREMMVGTGGTSKTGAVYHYYGCKNVLKRKGCKKKNVKKDYIEDFVIAEARKQLTDENINLIAGAVSEISRQENNAPIIAELKRKLKDNARAVENLLKAIEEGEHISLLSERITKKQEEQANLEKALAMEQMAKNTVEESEVRFFLHKLKKGDIHDEVYKKALIAIFINAVYLYDDRATIIFNASERPVEVDYSLVDEIENPYNNEVSGGGRCSYMTATSPDCFQYTYAPSKPHKSVL